MINIKIEILKIESKDTDVIRYGIGHLISVPVHLMPIILPKIVLLA